jgi:hypothetical protein
MNPGRASRAELLHYRSGGGTYQSVVDWYQRKGLRHPYHRHLYKLLGAIGIRGPVLWTELAKCETAVDAKTSPPLQTFRVCSAAFLQRELDALPLDWPLIAVGKDAFTALAFRFPTRSLLGVPHPTGSRGHFHALFGRRSLRHELAAIARVAIRTPGRAVWLARSANGAV